VYDDIYADGPDGYSTSTTISTTGTHTLDIDDSNDTSTYVLNIASVTSGDSVTVSSIDVLSSTNGAPTADAGANQTVTVGSNVTLDASGSSDPDGDPLTYSWDFTGDGTEDATGVSPSTSYDTVDSHTATLTVEDEHGATDTDTVTITAEESTQTVEFNVTNSTGDAIENATINVSDSNDTVVAELETDVDGLASTSLADGDYSYSVDAEGYDSEDGNITVSDSTENVDVTLSEEDTLGGGGGSTGDLPVLPIAIGGIVVILSIFALAVAE
jgi:hypothetical protein